MRGRPLSLTLFRTTSTLPDNLWKGHANGRILTPKTERTPGLELTVNGETQQVEPGTTVAALLEQLGLEARLVAVERNLDLVPRSTHARCVLEPQDRLEIVTLVGGG